MNKEQRAALRRLAEEATPGPWLYDETELPAQRIHHPEGFLVARVAQMRTDGRYIAAANPSTILQLLDYIESLERDAAHKQARIDSLMLEFCPEEMTEGQLAEWAKHQVPAQGDTE